MKDCGGPSILRLESTLAFRKINRVKEPRLPIRPVGSAHQLISRD